MRTPSILLTDEVADRLLAGEHPAHPVGLVLSAATRPATAHELTGEAAARQAFVASPTCHAGGSPQRGRHRLRTDRALFTAKAVGAAALALTAGGVAVAATGPSGGTLTPVADEPTDTVSAPSRTDAHATATTAPVHAGDPAPVAEVDCDPLPEQPQRVTGAWIAGLVRGEASVGAGRCWPARRDRSPSDAVAFGATPPGKAAAVPSTTTGPFTWTGPGSEGRSDSLSGPGSGAGGDAATPSTTPDPRPALGRPGSGPGAQDPDETGARPPAAETATPAPTPTPTPSAPPSSSPPSGTAGPSGASGASSGDPTTPSRPRDHRHGP